jgi:methylated-DNA-[protein]-cysteine S-methyltransferase
MVLHVTFATRSLGPLQRLTERCERLTVEAYPLDGFLLLRGLGDTNELADAPEILASGRRVLHSARNDRDLTLLLEGHADDAGVITRLADRDAHVLPPIVWRHGEALVTLLVDDRADLVALEAEFPEARLLSKREAKGGPRVAFGSPLFLPQLTEKQAKALLAAFNAGYYEFPRRSTTEDVSTSLGVARSTFEQHLNRAEHHVVKAMLPIVRMRAGLAREEALAVYSRFSRELGLYVRLEVLGDQVTGIRLSKEPAPMAAGADHPYLAQILEHIRTGEGDLRDIPLHLELTRFEREVLDLLRTIPPGSTTTYGEIARRLGRPKAARAVGNAVARNPAIIVIPCHRVVPKSGGIGNYSAEGGAETKRKLLERERAPFVLPAVAKALKRQPTRRATR